MCFFFFLMIWWIHVARKSAIQIQKDFCLLLQCQNANTLYNFGDFDQSCANECVEIHKDKHCHNQLTIHSISHASVSREKTVKIFNSMCSFHSTLKKRNLIKEKILSVFPYCKESSKRSNKRCKDSKCKSMNVDRCNRYRLYSS